VKCPTCEKEVEWSDENPWRPFCSDRCRMIDLGEWVNETRKIPAEDMPLSEEIDNK
ncbi:MAG: DNA gyrase inhibitor YacG, partial [Gammaproteobacteria bacterium]|nr:DNA gyrase inhibitor YacG [Gammaproteobacteria bacterium]